MRSSRRFELICFCLLFGIIATTVVLRPWLWWQSEPADLARLGQRVQALEQEVAEARDTNLRATDTYAPVVQGQITDVTSPAVEILRQLPGVVDVSALVTCDKPTHRIIHLRDWHHVPRDLFALDLNDRAGLCSCSLSSSDHAPCRIGLAVSLA
jgi:hypothetical protein